ncbi:uncharacterized protein At5g39865 [Phalaenopsis equestris]|uniref:uncharacterized protein At5g39865 n=1 Tax=Phalaenopsis equestris TaxID=78828 RepID=UPI0009E4E845|nr:uncharacterized protein At5g39865 [Phalaenopsis equestris]
MWPKWGKPSRNDTSSPAADLPSSVATPSFKDIHSLLHDEDETGAACRRKASVFHRVRMATAALRTWRSLQSSTLAESGDKRIVLYYTSLRVVRKTFEDCRMVRSILRGFRVAVDERDLTMDSAFLTELKGLLGRQQLSLPRVFIGGRYIGGAEEIRQLHESGELKLYIEGAPPAAASACEACGGVRFLLCSVCNGSRKCHTDKGGFRSCGCCNENGLVRCPDCCTPIV